MRILVVNPNISESVTESIHAEARRSVSPGTTLTMAIAPFGVAYIETCFEALVGGYATACTVAEHAGQFDDVVVAAFGGPGLASIKELCNVPVVGVTEAALASACLLGQHFSIIAISNRIQAWYRECVAASGPSSRLASVHSLQQPLRDIGSVQEDHAARLEELSVQAVREDDADVIIVAGTPLTGLAHTLKDHIPVSVVDGVSSAIRHCESLITLAPNGAAEGSFARLPYKPNRGLPPALAIVLA